MTGVLIIDDHPIVTQGCRQLLEDARVTEIYEARDIADGYGQYRAHRPDVIILDLTIGKSELGGHLIHSTPASSRPANANTRLYDAR